MRGLLVNEFPSWEGQGVAKTPLGKDISKSCTWRLLGIKYHATHSFVLPLL